MDLQVTIDDPKTYTKPFTYKISLLLLPDTDLLENFCDEDEKDAAHGGQEVIVISPRTFCGIYCADWSP